MGARVAPPSRSAQAFAKAELCARALERARSVVELERVLDHSDRRALIAGDEATAPTGGCERPGDLRLFRVPLQRLHNRLGLVRTTRSHVCLDEIGVCSELVGI